MNDDPNTWTSHKTLISVVLQNFNSIFERTGETIAILSTFFDTCQLRLHFSVPFEPRTGCEQMLI